MFSPDNWFSYLEPRQFLSAGAPINTFGDHGRARFQLADGELIHGVAIQKDGAVVMAGGSHGDFFLTRLRSDGKVDTGFGVDGKVRTNIVGDNDDARAVAIQPD